MFMQMKTNFEQSLRARIFPVTPAQNGSNPGLNPEFHRGCTGKAHACGTAKSRLLQQRANNNNNTTTETNSTTTTTTSTTTTTTKVNGKKLVQRKNSISSETISDSGSENSAPSWLDTTDCVAKIKNNQNNVANSSSNSSIGGGGKISEGNKRMPQLRKSNLKRNTSSIGYGGKLLPTSTILARKSPTSTPIATTAERRRRLHSEGDRMSETGASNASTNSINVTQQQNGKYKQHREQQQQKPESTFERTQRYRSFRVGNNGLRRTVNKSTNAYTTPIMTTTAAPITINITRPTTPSNNNIVVRPPWNSGSALKGTVTSASPTFNTRNYRNSFRRRDVVDWSAIWERSFVLRGHTVNSGLYKNYNETIKRKVRKLI